jgi:hypothetical protein
VDMGTEKYATPLSLASGFAAGLMFAGWRLQQRRVRRHVRRRRTASDALRDAGRA